MKVAQKRSSLGGMTFQKSLGSQSNNKEVNHCYIIKDAIPVSKRQGPPQFEAILTHRTRPPSSSGHA